MDKYDELITKMMDDPPIQELYDNCIIKDITYKEWVVGMVDRCFRANTEDHMIFKEIQL